MIGYLQGTLLRSDPERLLLDVQGVGYEVNVPLSTWYEIEKRREAPIGLFIHTQMREDGIALFGFWTEREKAPVRAADRGQRHRPAARPGDPLRDGGGRPDGRHRLG